MACSVLLLGLERSVVRGDGLAAPPLQLQAADRGAGNQQAATPKRARISWTSSHFAGTPDPPPPYTVELAFPKLKFEFPVVLVPAQGMSRLFVGELRGRIYSFPNDPDCAKGDLALDLAKRYPDLSALYGISFHPQFEKNRYVYLCYVRKNDLPDG